MNILEGKYKIPTGPWSAGGTGHILDSLVKYVLDGIEDNLRKSMTEYPDKNILEGCVRNNLSWAYLEKKSKQNKPHIWYGYSIDIDKVTAEYLHAFGVAEASRKAEEELRLKNTDKHGVQWTRPNQNGYPILDKETQLYEGKLKKAIEHMLEYGTMEDEEIVSWIIKNSSLTDQQAWTLFEHEDEKHNDRVSCRYDCDY